MKVFGIILILLVLAGVGVYVDGARLPYDHSVSVTGVVAAPPDKVFALITNVAKGSDWRPAVKSVTLLQPDQGRDHWVEHLKYGQFMTFLAVRTEPPMRRDVKLEDPKASYGGTWTYELSPGPDRGHDDAAHHGNRVHQAADLPVCHGACDWADPQPGPVHEGHPGGCGQARKSSAPRAIAVDANTDQVEQQGRPRHLGREQAICWPHPRWG